MAALSEQERANVWADFMRKLSLTNESLGAVSKADLRAAVDAIDQFLEDNATTINNAFPQPARANLTVPQKARLLAYVALRRWGGT